MDGGQTGCSLSRVSKTVRNVSRAGRFTTVALRAASAQQISLFLRIFSQERDQAAKDRTSQPKVRYLFLASARRMTVPELPLLFKNDSELQAFQRDVKMLMDLVALDLYTLFLLQGHHPSLASLWFPGIGQTSFPQLQELHLIGGGCEFAPEYFYESLALGNETSEGILPSLPSLPRLTHLHLSGETHSTALSMAIWARRSPGITHLRFTNLSQDPDLEELVRESLYNFVRVL